MSIENGKLGLTEAEGFCLDWKLYAQRFFSQLPADEIPRAFTIRRAELEFLLLQMTILECDATRFYFGLKPSESNPSKQVPCLLMAGVREFVPNFKNPAESQPGTEVYFTSYPESLATGAAVETPYVLDFAYPCPDTCQIDSPLMNPPTPA